MTKSKVISIRLSSDELDKIKKVAKQLHMKKSDVMRLALNDSLKHYKPINLTTLQIMELNKNRKLALDKLGTLSTKVDRLLHNYSRMGNNFNQIAHMLHIGRYSFNNKGINDMYMSIKELIGQKYNLSKEMTKIWQLLELPTRRKASRR